MQSEKEAKGGAKPRGKAFPGVYARYCRCVSWASTPAAECFWAVSQNVRAISPSPCAMLVV